MLVCFWTDKRKNRQLWRFFPHMAREKFEQVLGAIGHVLPGQFVLYYGCIPITHKEIQRL